MVELVALELELADAVLHHVPDADDAGQPPVGHHREVPDAQLGHRPHQVGDVVGGVDEATVSALEGAGTAAQLWPAAGQPRQSGLARDDETTTRRGGALLVVDGFGRLADDTALREVARGIVGDDLVVEMPNPVMGAEDWSYVLQQVPGAMAFLGTCPPGEDFHGVAPNHSNRMVIDEDAMAVGVALYAATALDELAAR